MDDKVIDRDEKERLKANKALVEKRIRLLSHGSPPVKVVCQGCGEALEDTGGEGVEYVKTKRGTEIFFHKRCINDVWRTKIK